MVFTATGSESAGTPTPRAARPPCEAQNAWQTSTGTVPSGVPSVRPRAEEAHVEATDSRPHGTRAPWETKTRERGRGRRVREGGTSGNEVVYRAIELSAFPRFSGTAGDHGACLPKPSLTHAHTTHPDTPASAVPAWLTCGPWNALPGSHSAAALCHGDGGGGSCGRWTPAAICQHPLPSLLPLPTFLCPGLGDRAPPGVHGDRKHCLSATGGLPPACWLSSVPWMPFSPGAVHRTLSSHLPSGCSPHFR